MAHHLGIIGFGGMAEYHFNTVRRADVDMSATAAFDVRPQRRARAEELGLKAYDNVEDFLRDGGFDLVLVATPNNHHARYACLAMEAGYDVICEKPVAMNAAEVEEMIAVSKKTGRFFTVHQNRRYDSDFRLMMKAVREGKIGTPMVIESHCQMRNDSGCMYNWRGMEDHGGGMLRDWGIHMLDQLLWYVGLPVKTVSANILSVRSAEVDDYSKLVLTFEGGLVAQMEVSTFSPYAMPRWMVYGDRGTVRIETMESPTASVRRIRKDHWSRLEAPAYPDKTGFVTREQKIFRVDEFEEETIDRTDIGDGWEKIYLNIRDVLDGKAELFVKPEEVLNTMRVIDAAFESAKTGLTVALGK